MPRIVEEEVQDGLIAILGDVHRDGHRTLFTFFIVESVGESLRRNAVVVNRRLVVEPTVTVDIGEHRPPALRTNHKNGKLIGVLVVTVDVCPGDFAQRQLSENAGVIRRARDAGDATETGQRLAPVRHRVAGDGHTFECNSTFAGKIAYIENLRLTGSGCVHAGQVEIHAAVQNANEHATAVGGRIACQEIVHAGAGEWHEPDHHRHARLYLRIVGAPWWWRRFDRPIFGLGLLAIGFGRRRILGPAFGAGAGARGEQREQCPRGVFLNGSVRSHLHRCCVSKGGSTNGPRWGPSYCVAARRINASASLVSSGVTIASTKPRAPANFASS